MFFAYLAEEFSHFLGVHFVAQAVLKAAIQGADGSLHAGEFALVAVLPHWPRAGGRPAAPGAGHAPEAGFVLKHEAGLFAVRLGFAQMPGHHHREFFFQSAWAASSVLGWVLSGATLRQPCRASIR